MPGLGEPEGTCPSPRARPCASRGPERLAVATMLKKNFMCLFLAVLGLLATARAFFSCRKQGLLLVVVRRRLTWVASLAEERGL